MIYVDEKYVLDSFKYEDADGLAEAINDQEIANNTLTIPFPYTRADAEWFFANKGISEPGKVQRNWVIRNQDGNVCGGIGYYFKYGPKSHKDEMGYWLTRQLWGKGIMTKVVGAFCNFANQERNLTRIEAPIFAFNKGSASVLEKNGFELEGRLRNAYFKNGQYQDGLLCAKVMESAK